MYDFIMTDFYEKMKQVKFDVYGMLDVSGNIHTLGTDSKIIGRIFEMFTQPILEEIASEHGMILKTPESQTVYPDFVMMKNEASPEKIAIDVKTTYVDTDQSTIKFTLGSFGSYMRNNTKNIAYRYTDYAKHYVIGFVYKRNDAAQESRVYPYAERDGITFPYRDVKYFIQEKFKIAGDKPGSGNTENIGSFSTKSFSEICNGNGPFSELGVEVFDLYWRYYPKYRSPEQHYTSLPEFVRWFLVQPEEQMQMLHSYDYTAVRKTLEAYAEKHGIK